MPEIHAQRRTAEIEGDFVVFLIGMRVNKMWKVAKWVPVARAMGRMLNELYAAGPEKTGFLGHQNFGMGGMVQYWRSFEHLETYARAAEAEHWPAWSAFNKAMKGAREDVGIWHETYLVPAGQYEAVYSGMPDFGLIKAAKVCALDDASRARDRIEQPDAA
ncbi:MAG: DUF4188 domain-containing protein [Pseudomonadota bacterium]